MDIEKKLQKKLFELELKGYSLKFSGDSAENNYLNCWFEYEKYVELGDEDWEIYDATFSSSAIGDKFRITIDCLYKLEKYLEVQRH